jgi:hypothetical protein
MSELTPESDSIRGESQIKKTQMKIIRCKFIIFSINLFYFIVKLSSAYHFFTFKDKIVGVPEFNPNSIFCMQYLCQLSYSHGDDEFIIHNTTIIL